MYAGTERGSNLSYAIPRHNSALNQTLQHVFDSNNRINVESILPNISSSIGLQTGPQSELMIQDEGRQSYRSAFYDTNKFAPAGYNSAQFMESPEKSLPMQTVQNAFGPGVLSVKNKRSLPPMINNTTKNSSLKTTERGYQDGKESSGKTKSFLDQVNLRNILDFLPKVDLTEETHPELRLHFTESHSPASVRDEYRMLNETPTVSNIHQSPDAVHHSRPDLTHRINAA